MIKQKDLGLCRRLVCLPAKRKCSHSGAKQSKQLTRNCIESVQAAKNRVPLISYSNLRALTVLEGHSKACKYCSGSLSRSSGHRFAPPNMHSEQLLTSISNYTLLGNLLILLKIWTGLQKNDMKLCVREVKLGGENESIIVSAVYIILQNITNNKDWMETSRQ